MLARDGIQPLPRFRVVSTTFPAERCYAWMRPIRRLFPVPKCFMRVESSRRGSCRKLAESDYPNLAGPLTIWNNKYMVQAELNRYGEIAHFVQHVNLLDAYIRAVST